jgi:hypothetical protein
MVFQCKDMTPKGGDKEWDGFTDGKKKELLKGVADSLTLVCCLSWGLFQFGYFIMYSVYPKESLSLNAHPILITHPNFQKAEISDNPAELNNLGEKEYII